MKKKTSPKRHLFLTKNFIMMLVMLVVIIVAVSAWFTQYKTVEATDIVVQMVSTEIDVAHCVKTYNSDGTVKTDGPGDFGPAVGFDVPGDYGKFVKDCTGDGVTLIVPEFNVTNDYESLRKNGGKQVNTNLGATDAWSNLDVNQYLMQNPEQDSHEYQYLEFEFYVRSKNKALLLMPESRVIATTEKQGSTLSTVLEGKRSEYGNFSVDGIVGAIRVSLVGEGCTSVSQTWNNGSLVRDGVNAPNTARNVAERQLFWIPRPDVLLNIANDTGDIKNWTLSTDVSSQTAPDNYKATYYKDVRDGSNNRVGVAYEDEDEDAVVSNGTYSEGLVTVKSLGQQVNITDFTYFDNLQPIQLVVDGTNPDVKSNYYVTKYTMKVWIEGTDVEARRAMDGGSFSIKLSFA